MTCPARRGELKHLIVALSPDGEIMLRFVLRSQKHVALLRSRLRRSSWSRLPEAVVVSVNLHPDHKAVLEGHTEIVLTERAVLPMRVGDSASGSAPTASSRRTRVVAAGLYRQAQEWIAADAPGRSARPLLRRRRVRGLHAAPLEQAAPEHG